VRGPKGFGRASVHLIKRTDQVDHEYKYFYVDVKGHQRIWLENADAARAKPGERKPWRLFGVNWS
jgi:import inner membrane translocase subunit TIM21